MDDNDFGFVPEFVQEIAPKLPSKSAPTSTPNSFASEFVEEFEDHVDEILKNRTLNKREQEILFAPKKQDRDKKKETEKIARNFEEREEIAERNPLPDQSLPTPSLNHKSSKSTALPEDQWNGEEFDIPSQQWMSISLTHKFIRPYSTEAGIRLNGVFETPEECRLFNEKLMKLQPNSSFFSMPKFKWFPMVSTHEKITHPSYNADKTNKVLEDYKLKLEKAKEVFGKPEYERKADSVNKLKKLSNKKEGQNRARQKALKIARENRIKELKEIHPDEEVLSSFDFPRNEEQRNLTHAVMVFVDDNTTNYKDEKEPVFCWLCARPDEKVCDTYVRGPAQSVVRDHDMVIVPMYEWLYPCSIKESGKVRTVYRNSDLDKIMQNPSIEKNRIKSFAEYCKSNNMHTPETVITKDGQVYGVDIHGNKVEKIDPLVGPQPLNEEKTKSSSTKSTKSTSSTLSASSSKSKSKSEFPPSKKK